MTCGVSSVLLYITPMVGLILIIISNLYHHKITHLSSIGIFTHLSSRSAVLWTLSLACPYRACNVFHLQSLVAIPERENSVVDLNVHKINTKYTHELHQFTFIFPICTPGLISQFTQPHPTQQSDALGQLSTSTIYQGYSQNHHNIPKNVGLYADIHVQIDLHISQQGDAALYMLITIVFRAVWRIRVIWLRLLGKD